MDSNSPSPNEETNEQKDEFRKPTNEAAHRKYRRRSPLDVLSDEDGSPKRDHRSSRDTKAVDYERRSDDRMNDRLSSGSQHGRHSDPYKHSSRGSRHGEHHRHGKQADEDDKRDPNLSHRTGRDSRGGSHSDLRDRGSDHNTSRDRYRDVDRKSRDRSDVAVKKYRESSSGRTVYDGRHGSRYDDHDRYARDRRDDKREYKNSRDHRSDFKSKWETGSVKDLDDSKCEEESKLSNLKNDLLDKHGDKLDKAGKKAEHSSTFVSEASTAKRPKLFSSENTEAKKVDETSGSKFGTDKATVNASDSGAGADAAKVAAMKAAELVNKNLTGAGIMTADQKKKLLWGSKKSTTAEETSHRWDAAMFSDRERQEKFNKLMSLRLPWYIWPIVGCEGRSEGECQTRKQPRCRETASRFGETIHGWAPTKGRSHCRIRIVEVHLRLSAETVGYICLYLF